VKKGWNGENEYTRLLDRWTKQVVYDHNAVDFSSLTRFRKSVENVDFTDF